MDGDISIDIPDGIEPLVGYRGWKVREVDGKPMLRAVTYDEFWPPGKVAAEALCSGRSPRTEITLHEIPAEDFAECERQITELVKKWAENWSDPHEPPNENCRCGLYARLNRDEIADGEVAGRIEAWGKIVKGPYGFRAQYARITGLYLRAHRGWFTFDEENDDALEARRAVLQPIADLYEVPILDLPEQGPRPPIAEFTPAFEANDEQTFYDIITKMGKGSAPGGARLGEQT